GYEEGLKRGFALLDQLELWPYLLGFVPPKEAKEAACRLPQDADLRLAALLTDKSAEEIVDCLSHRGLRYSNKRVQKALDLVKGYRDSLAGRPLPLVAASAHLSEVTNGVSALLTAYGHSDLADRLVLAEATLLERKVPLTPSALPIDPQQLKDMGVPDDKLGTTLRYLVQEGVARMAPLHLKECLALAARYKEKHLC
ncbi:MAG: hypothetical protein J5755_03535, partial [Clostridia bacterium]|nr:hypothetical protein [Clostridia bacterium]